MSYNQCKTIESAQYETETAGSGLEHESAASRPFLGVGGGVDISRGPLRTLAVDDSIRQ